MKVKIPEATIMRMSVYSRFLADLDRKDIIMISSFDIAERVGVSPVQVRKDFSLFGEFGKRGVGYNVKELHWQILKILSLDASWSVALVGLGNLGSALSSYKGFHERGLIITSIFDNNPGKIGTFINNVEILPMDKLVEVVKYNQTQIGIISVPSEYAQEIANLLVEGGVQAILNFAPVVLNLPREIKLRNVDVTVNLEILTFNSVKIFGEIKRPHNEPLFFA
ncbi:MAG: redox-sensing transcriptional repressor Rex [Bacillota bacterium]|nr:redox-sensing transcriptional repressor Rex [Bacillota bacterium]MDP4159220.1 redox-sensing transcriptional repressor Rex [Bacillota bacterium]